MNTNYFIPPTDEEIKQRLTELLTQAQAAKTRREIKQILHEWEYLNAILRLEHTTYSWPSNHPTSTNQPTTRVSS